MKRPAAEYEMLLTHSRDLHRKFFDFRIEILAIRALLCALGTEGLNRISIVFKINKNLYIQTKNNAHTYATPRFIESKIKQLQMHTK